MSKLVFVEQQPLAGRVIPVEEGTTIGREGCDVALPDPEVSRNHAVIGSDGEGPVVEDLGSTNGTWVNEKRLTGPVALRPGDTVRFGNTVWHVEVPGAVTRVARSSAPPE